MISFLRKLLLKNIADRVGKNSEQDSKDYKNIFDQQEGIVALKVNQSLSIHHRIKKGDETHPLFGANARLLVFVWLGICFYSFGPTVPVCV